MNPSARKHLLVLRFSALGDVTMTVPVITRLLQQHPGLQITFVSNEKFRPLFQDIPGLEFFGITIPGQYKGAVGLYRLFRQLKKKFQIDAVADLHDSLRSKILSFYFRLSGIPVRTIDKGRQEKKLLTRRKNKQLLQLTAGYQRYADVFAALGFPVRTTTDQPAKKLIQSEAIKNLLINTDKKTIGLAPFAKHKEKMYPPDKMEKVVEILLGKGYTIFFFGGGAEEVKHLQEWERRFPGTINTAGKLSFTEELELISHLDIMISMDSANMHLASLYGVPVVSIWGATHPFAGFYGFGQSPENAVQVELYCRPCSVFGNKKCYRGDHACMNMISEEQIINRVEKVLAGKQ